MNYYPVYLELDGRECLVIGGGRIAERKIRQLLRSGASVTIISPRITGGLRKLVESGRVRHKERTFRKGDTRNAFLVIAATSDERVNSAVSRESDGLVNAVDMPEHCSFIMPSVIRKGSLAIAISTSGISPALSRTFREELENYFPVETAQFLSYLEKKRKLILINLPGTSQEIVQKRTKLLKKLGSKEILGILRKQGFSKAKKKMDEIINAVMI